MSSQTDTDDEYLFDQQLLKSLAIEIDGKRNEKFESTLTENNLIIRPLKSGDFDKGFITLLNQLTEVGNVTKKQFHERFKQMKLHSNHYILVIEDVVNEKIIGSATLLIELKFIHNCALKGYLEDVVVCHDYRGKQLGKFLIETMTQLGQRLGVYKVILNCKDQLIEFYERLGFIKEEGNANMLQMRFKNLK